MEIGHFPNPLSRNAHSPRDEGTSQNDEFARADVVDDVGGVHVRPVAAVVEKSEPPPQRGVGPLDDVLLVGGLEFETDADIRFGQRRPLLRRASRASRRWRLAKLQ